MGRKKGVLGGKTLDIKAKYVDKNGITRVENGNTAYVRNGLRAPAGGYHCPGCGIELMLSHLGRYWYFKAKPNRKTEEEKNQKFIGNGHDIDCEYYRLRKIKKEQAKRYHSDLTYFNPDIELEKQRREKDIKPGKTIHVPGFRMDISEKDFEIEVIHGKPKILKVKSFHGMYIASYHMDGKSPVGKDRVPIRQLIINGESISDFRAGKAGYSIDGIRGVVATKVYPDDEIVKALKQSIDMDRKGVWVLVDPYNGPLIERVFYVFDTYEHSEAGRAFASEVVRGGKTSSLYFIACEWTLPDRCDKGQVAIKIGPDEYVLRCSIGHIRSKNDIRVLPPLGNERSEEPAEEISLFIKPKGDGQEP